MFCYITNVMSCYITYVILYNIGHVMLFNICHVMLSIISFLTITPRGRVGYGMKDSQRGAYVAPSWL